MFFSDYGCHDQAFTASVIPVGVYTMVHGFAFLVELGYAFKRTDDYAVAFDFHAEESFHPVVE